MAELCKSKYSVRVAKYEGDLVVQLKDYYSSTSLVDMKVNIDFIIKLRFMLIFET